MTGSPRDGAAPTARDTAADGETARDASPRDAAANGTTANRAAVMVGLGELRLESRPVPEPAPGEVLVEVAAVGVCGSDVHFFEHGRIGLDVVEPPHVLGHEVSGVVVGHGAGVDGPPIGTRVAVDPSRPCGSCRVCRGGRYNLCPRMRYLSAPPTDGAFAHYVTAPHDFVFPVPDEVSDDAAALVEPLAVVVHAARRAGIAGGDRVLVTGAGPIGLLMTQVARAFGAAEVIVSDRDERRLALAAELGASRTVDVGREQLAEAVAEVDVLVECSGNPRALPDGIRCVAAGGVAAVVGMSPAEEATIPIAVMQAREIALVPTFRFANAYAPAIALLTAGMVRPEAIVTGHYGLAETERALRAGGEVPGSVKVMVHPREDATT